MTVSRRYVLNFARAVGGVGLILWAGNEWLRLGRGTHLLSAESVLVLIGIVTIIWPPDEEVPEGGALGSGVLHVLNFFIVMTALLVLAALVESGENLTFWLWALKWHFGIAVFKWLNHERFITSRVSAFLSDSKRK